jgi:hypothetical protein
LESEVSASSQPLAWLLSQFPKPGSQAPSTQLPVAQLCDALAREQATLQPPQLVSDVRGASQPLA